MELFLEIIWNLILVIFLVFLNGFFVASEFAIVKVRGTRIAQLSQEGNRRAKVADKVIRNMDAYLSATQLGITLASLGLGWIGEPAVAHLIVEPLLKALPFGVPEWLVNTLSFGIAFGIITFLHIVLGEMAPKSLAIRRAEGTTLWTAAPLNWFYKGFYPFIWVLNGAANKILSWLGIELDPEQQQAHTEEEIRMLVAQSHKSGHIDQTELSLFDNVFEFTDRVAREVMVPRVDMVCLYTDDSLDENLKTIREARHTRFPLCREDKDDIIGIVHIRHVYEKLLSQETPDLTELTRPVIRVPETMEIKDVLRILQKNKSEMAIVVDEYGGTAGLVTTEDIIEEIFGEIQDEFDDERPFFQKTGAETSIDARLLIEEVNEYFRTDIEDPDNDTIGGWIFSRLNEVPEVGDEVYYNGLRFKVQEIDQHSVGRILVTRTENNGKTGPKNR
ncbi:CBS domain containing-hemolysin-like protein [Melghirimyces profundicolus]|uniref:CBS domain containing-hemolysin-like protein n=1 Tax=Melghirimyces profundicolus TaxID=1242148 RepID=A0A2T6BQH7_9BACL|nr:hemolysin family protein [Melghirimyces profundicolus]PTX58304.1 CBS domain containing-hemolysin-like protein [Melghirimyces profundicolus]